MKRKTFLIVILPTLALVGAWLLREAFATSNPHSWTNGLVGYWSFDGQYTTSTNGTRDVSNNNNWGAFNNGVKPVPGITGQALSFDGANDYVNAGSGANLDITGTAITIEFWIKPNVASGYILAKGSPTVTSPYWQYDLEFNGAKIRWGGDMSGSPVNKDSTGVISVGQWSHVMVTYNGSNISYYFNGVLDSAPVLTGNLMTHPTWELWIGDIAWDSTNFNGLLDEVRIYNRALSASEAKQHYDQTKRNFTVNQSSGTPPVGWWKLDENPTSNGSIIHDYSANANNGTVSNGGYGATSTDGRVGRALDFDGVNDYVDAGAGASLNITGTAITLEAWVYPTVATQGEIITKSNPLSDPPYRQYALHMDGTRKLRFSGDFDGTYGDAVSTGTITLNSWSHVVSVYDGSNVYFYINGVLDSSPSRTGNITTHSTWKVNIGRDDYGSNWFTGKIDEARIYNYVRTADQIASSYRAGAYRTIIATSNSNDWSNGLVGYWSFDGQYTTSTNGTRDVSGNGNWATFKNGTKPIAGISGQALSFDGNNDYVDAGNGASVRLTSAISIEAWVRFTGWPKPNPSDAREHIVAKGREGAGLPDTALAYSTAVETYSLTDERLYFFIYHNSSVSSYIDYTSSDGFRKDYGNWHHYAFTWDGTTNANGIKLYVDGGLKDQKAASATGIQDATSNLQFGFAETFYGNLYGSLDEVRLYNRALSTNEIEQHYQQSRRNLGL